MITHFIILRTPTCPTKFRVWRSSIYTSHTTIQIS